MFEVGPYWRLGARLSEMVNTFLVSVVCILWDKTIYDILKIIWIVRAF